MCIRLARRFAEASVIMSLKDPGLDPGIWWLSYSPGGWLGCDCGAGYRAGAGPEVPFLFLESL